MYRASAKRQELGTQGNDGAPQPAESTADASHIGGLPTVRLKLGCFNCGIAQDMLSKADHQQNLRRVISKAVGEQDFYMVNLCEVGGHKEGLQKSTVSAQDLVSQALSWHYKATSCQAYMTTWQADHDPSERTSVILTLQDYPEVVEIPSSLQPQLVIMVFTIAAAEHPDKHGLLISGSLHIRTPTGKNTTKATKNGS